MRVFSSLSQRAMRWSRHRHAPWYLGGLSFAESSFFPIPPDVMLVPMSLANPYKVFTIAAGALSMALLPFALASLIGRGARFFLVAGLMAWGGARMRAVPHGVWRVNCARRSSQNPAIFTGDEAPDDFERSAQVFRA
ncbi:MAG: hypothetical protein KJZ83_07310 [Burkholderiaceae bacterium]|nr:hypothetical protein [Burkholderiaceae bacterium]